MATDGSRGAGCEGEIWKWGSPEAGEDVKWFLAAAGRRRQKPDGLYSPLWLFGASCCRRI